MNRPFCSGAQQPERARAREAAAAAERPADPSRVGGDANGEWSACGGGDAVAAERDVANSDRDRRRPGRPVPRLVEGEQLDRVDALPHGSSAHLPVPDDRLLRAWKPRQRAPLPVDEEHAAAVLAQPVADRELVAPPVAVGRDDAGAHRHVLDHRRRHVDPDRVRQRDRLVLAAHVDPRPVVALRQDSAGVVAAVPADHDRPLRIALPPLDRPHDLAAVDDRDVEPVGLAQLEGDPRRLLRAIADGREHGLHARAEDRALLQLQSLGERERRGGGREQGDHQHRRGDTSHWRGILVFAAWRAVQWLRSDDGARGRSIRRHVGGRRPCAALQPGDDRDPRARRDHRRPVVAARRACAAARRRADLRPPLVPPVLRLLRARPATAGRRAARGRAAAPCREHRRRRRPVRGEPRLRGRLRDSGHSARRDSLPHWRSWPRRPASASAARRTSSATGSRAGASSPARCRHSRRRARARSSRTRSAYLRRSSSFSSPLFGGVSLIAPSTISANWSAFGFLSSQ